MPSPDVVLFLVGALFLVVGLAGSVELTAVKIPSVGKFQRLVAFGIGIAFIGIGFYVNQQGQADAANPGDSQPAAVESAVESPAPKADDKAKE